MEQTDEGGSRQVRTCDGDSGVEGKQERELSILITQSMQRDFIETFSPLEGPPNLLHIGELQSYKILGQTPETGPLALLFDWAREKQQSMQQGVRCGSSSPMALEIVHLRDWHDPNNPSQVSHLRSFGAHCIKNTRGAELVANLEKGAHSSEYEHVIDATGINDCEETPLLDQIKKLILKWNATKLRIGVIGVFTDAKVLFLLYDLHSRLPHFISSSIFPNSSTQTRRSNFSYRLATCSALTAGSSLAAHTLALQQMKTLLEVDVIDSVADFSEWLLPSANKLGNSRPFHVKDEVDGMLSFCPRIELYGMSENLCSSSSTSLSLSELSSTDKRIICFLYKSCTQISMKRLRGGFSGSSVWKVESTDSFGNIQIPSVLKIGPRKTIATERVNFEMLVDILGNNTPQVRGYVEDEDRGGIRFNYALMSTDGGGVEPFTVIYHDKSQAWIDRVLKELFLGILFRMYSAAKHESIDLLDFYDFDGKGWSWGKGGSDTPSKVQERIALLLPDQSPTSPNLIFPSKVKLYNIALFLEHDLPNINKILKSRHERHLVSLVHGDLHGGNILIDEIGNIWVIDFGYAGKGHVLKDITKLENDILYEMTPIGDEEAFSEGLIITRTLLSVRDLRRALPERLEGVHSESMKKAWRTVRLLRHITASISKAERNPYHLFVPLLRYALHSLCFDHLTVWQKRLALASACMIAENLRSRRRFNIVGYSIDTIPLPIDLPGLLHFGSLPGRKDRTCSLEKDIEYIKSSLVDVVISLSPEEEVEWFGVHSSELVQRLGAEDILFVESPIVLTSSTSLLEEIRELLRKLQGYLHQGKKVLLTEAANLSRIVLVVACLYAEMKNSRSESDIMEDMQSIFHDDDRFSDSPAYLHLVKEFIHDRNLSYSSDG